ncbi:unnamed protein product [Fusarium graminearum]|nr:unnamed protein product [Fusarium graminearum]
MMNEYPRCPRVNTLFGPLALSARMAVITFVWLLYREMLLLMISVLSAVLPLGARLGRALMDV